MNMDLKINPTSEEFDNLVNNVNQNSLYNNKKWNNILKDIYIIVEHAFNCLFRGNMETKTTLLNNNDTVKRLRELLRSFDKYNNTDIYELYIKKKLKDTKKE